MPKHAGPSKAGKNKIKCEMYRARGTRMSNKLKRIMRSNGAKAAKEWLRQTALEVRGIMLPRTVRGPVAEWQRKLSEDR